MNLANLGKAGLLVAQNRLQTAGHNINNAATPGYSRQRVLTQTAGATATAAGWVGRGIRTVSVQRSYDNFLSRQLMGAQTKGAALSAYGEQISQINNLVADRTVGVSPALQNFFDGLQAVATAPADVAARQELLGRAHSLASQIRDANAFFDSQRSNINTQITTTVSQINSYLDRIQGLNSQIGIAKATVPGQPPNDLLDQRDQLVAELGQLTNIQIFEQDDQVNIAMGSGEVVLAGDAVFHLEAGPSGADPSRLTLHTTAPDGQGGMTAIELDESRITGGTLGGLLTFRRDALDTAQNDLGRLALGLASTINAQHREGYDLSGQAGQNFFDEIGAPGVLAHAGNSSAAIPDAHFTDISRVTDGDYQLRFDGESYVVTRQPQGTTVAAEVDPDSGVLRFDGLEIDVSSLDPQSGDQWLIQPTRNAAAHLSVAITDPDQVAAAGAADEPSGDGSGPPAAGSANGDNALALAALQTRKVLGGAAGSAAGQGAMSLNEAYAQLVNAVAVKTQKNETALKAQDALVQQNYAAQQSVSGVNLDEEFVDLQRFQEQYRASAQLINTASTLFDTLLSLRG